MTVTPASNQVGSATITLGVSDGTTPPAGLRSSLPSPGVLLAVGVGGALGGAARAWAALLGPQAGLPGWAVLVAVNVLGALAMGLVTARGGRLARPTVTTGVLGGFTTFSAFAGETLLLAQQRPAAALLNVGLHLTLCLVAVWAGIRVAA